jgi:hypothetical protein
MRGGPASVVSTLSVPKFPFALELDYLWVSSVNCGGQCIDCWGILVWAIQFLVTFLSALITGESIWSVRAFFVHAVA